MLSKNTKLQILILSAISLIFISGCKKQKQKGKKTRKAFRDLNYEELKESKNRLVSQGRKETAISHLNKMIPLCNDIKDIRNLTLEIANLYFDTKNLKEASDKYSQFVQLYPGDENIEYATYKLILSNHRLTLDKERDQSKTKSTIKLAKEFLERSDIFKQYKNEVEKILKTCQNRLLESEMSIFRHYVKAGIQLSARKRLENIEKEFMHESHDFEPEIITLACEYAETFNEEDLLKLKQEELKTKFPNWKAENVVLAKREKTEFVDKF